MSKSGHARSSNTAQFKQLPVSPDVQTDEVSPGEYVVSTKHHSNVGHEDILQETHTITHRESLHASYLISWADNLGVTHLYAAHDGGGECRVVQRAQHDGVHQNEAVRHDGEESDGSSGARHYVLTNDGSRDLPHDAGEHKLHNKQLIRPSIIRQRLHSNKHTNTHTEESLSTHSPCLELNRE